MTSQPDAMHQIAERLTQAHLPTQAYTLTSFPGYSVLTGTPTTDVHVIEAYLGPSHGKPGYSSFAMAQTFDKRFPSLAFLMLVERSDADGAPRSDPTMYNIDIDNKFSNIFLAAMRTGLNDLDPTGNSKGILVQSYHAKITLGDLVQASIVSTQALFQFKRDGQLAHIAVDYEDPLIVTIANGLSPLLKIVGDVHFLPRTKMLSQLKVPIRKPDSTGYFLIDNNSTALDQGFAFAYRHFRDHYVKYGYIQIENLEPVTI